TWPAYATAAVAAAALAYVLIARPFDGSPPDAWRTDHVADVAATLAVPAKYDRSLPDRKSDKGHWVAYTDRSGAVRITLTVDRAAEDTAHGIADSAAAEMYDDNGTYKQNGDYGLDMPSGGKARTRPDGDAAFHGRKAAGNTVVYTTDDSQHPRPREVQILYYKSTGGDMYKLFVSYPGDGDFTARGRAVAQQAIAGLEVDKV
ncbi:serine/threonine protein kinase, partial [Streptomyces sp. SID10815]|nr:serine/threonine protein kinase [Streptomyces sp. SID10815]